jgi:hypothetical protein
MDQELNLHFNFLFYFHFIFDFRPKIDQYHFNNNHHYTKIQDYKLGHLSDQNPNNY